MNFPMKLLLLKTNEKNLLEITDFLKFYIGNSLKIEKKKGIYFIYYDNLSNLALEEALNSFSSDVLVNFSLFESEQINNNEEYLRTLRFVDIFIDELVKNTFYDEKKLIELATVNNLHNKLVAQLAFRKYYDDTELVNLCKAMFKCNLNISKTADYLYIHRNTLKYKLDRFLKVTNFDLRIFKDAALLDLILKKI